MQLRAWVIKKKKEKETAPDENWTWAIIRLPLKNPCVTPLRQTEPHDLCLKRTQKSQNFPDQKSHGNKRRRDYQTFQSIHERLALSWKLVLLFFQANEEIFTPSWNPVR